MVKGRIEFSISFLEPRGNYVPNGNVQLLLVFLIEIFFRENFRFRTKFKISIPAKFMLEISWIFEIFSTKRGLEISWIFKIIATKRLRMFHSINFLLNFAEFLPPPPP